MTINHHLSDATLMSYAAGSLGEAMGLVVATHLSMCPHCQSRSSRFEMIGGSTLELTNVCEMRPGALDAIFLEIDKDEEDVSSDPKTSRTQFQDNEKPVVPSPLNKFLPNNFDEVDWQFMAPGIKSVKLEGISERSGTARLLKISPGITIPEHGHNGNELTLVLEGAFSDQIGRFQPGDIADIDDDVEHQPIADTGVACICLIATNGPLKFKSMVPKIVQYFTGF